MSCKCSVRTFVPVNQQSRACAENMGEQILLEIVEDVYDNLNTLRELFSSVKLDGPIGLPIFPEVSGRVIPSKRMQSVMGSVKDFKPPQLVLYIDNNKLSELKFIEFFKKNGHLCDLNCETTCNYCYNIANEVIGFDKDSINNYIKFLSILLNNTISLGRVENDSKV